jgi:hypothetical protein
MKSWISSAFADDALGSTSNNKPKPNGTNKLNSAIKPNNKVASKAPAKIDSPSFELENCSKSAIKLSTKSLRNDKENMTFAKPPVAGAREIHSTTSLFGRNEPQNRGDLVVNKSKVEQMSKILDDLLAKKNKGSIVVIEGPSGCGKYVI